MTWIKIDTALPAHRKVFALGDELRLSNPTVVGHLVALWGWALDNAPTGVITGIRPRALAAAAQFDGDPDDFLAALIAAGFIDRVGDQLTIHDWQEYAGRLIEEREANAQRAREARARRRAERAAEETSQTDRNDRF